MAEKMKKPSEPTEGATKPEQRKATGALPVPQKSGITVVGIGASAGGLQALQSFFEALPSNTGMAFVVVVHLHLG